MMTKVYHKSCGGHVGYTDDIKSKKQESKHFFLLNGKNPDYMSIVRIGCLKCGQYVGKSGMTI